MAQPIPNPSLNRSQRTASIMLAAMNGQRACVQRLITAGADVSLRNQRRERAIDLARQAGHAQLAEELKQAAGKSSWLPDF